MPEIAGIGLISAFLAGIVSFLSPCVLPIVPGYVSFIVGRSLDEMTDRRFTRQRAAALGLSSAFVAGFSMIFIALGASATALGQVLQSYRGDAEVIAGTIVVMFGLQMMGVFRGGLLSRDWRYHGSQLKGGTVLGAFLFGAAFAFGWTPCIGPILGSILTIGATNLDVNGGIVLLATYSMGLGLPFLAMAMFTDALLGKFHNLHRVSRYLQPISGAVIIAVGVAITTGNLTSLSTWLLEVFPSFQYVVF